MTRRISIHTPRVGSDNCLKLAALAHAIFQSTLPVWGATKFIDPNPRIGIISIHTPRVGSDRQCLTNATRHDLISIHTPRVGSDRIRRRLMGG